jgi:hypothetical protein
VLPAAQRADLAQICVEDGEVGPGALAEHGALDVRRLELAARMDDLAAGVDEHLPHVEAASGALADAEAHVDAVLGRGGPHPPERLRADDERVLEVALHELHPPGGGAEPDPPRVAGDPGLGEGDEVGAARRGLADEVDRLVDRRVGVQPHRFGLDDGGLVLLLGGLHGPTLDRA